MVWNIIWFSNNNIIINNNIQDQCLIKTDIYGVQEEKKGWARRKKRGGGGADFIFLYINPNTVTGLPVA